MNFSLNLSKLKGNLIILLTAMIWGTSFVSQKVGMDSISPAAFNGIRLIIGAIVLLPVILISDRIKVKKNAYVPSDKKTLFTSGIICGTFLCIATTLQTWGMIYTTSGKSGFITAMYIIFVPFFGIIMKRKLPKIAFISALIALFGLYLLSGLNNGLSLNFGDFLTLICALFFSFHILAIDYYSPKVDGIKLSALQFLTAGIINLIIMFISEKPDINLILSCAIPILYSGIFSCGIAYTLQIIGQKYADPATASVLMSLESVFALLSGMIILNETMTAAELSGCGLMFIAVIINTLKS